MKKNLFIAALLMGTVFTGKAQTVLFQDSFEDYDDFVIEGFGNWITLDLDESTVYSGGGGIQYDNLGAPQAYTIFNPTTAEVTNATSGDEVRNFDPKTGDKYAASWAAVMPGDGDGGNGPNDDWLVSPAVTLGSNGNTVTFWVKSMSDSYGLEEYEVGVFNGDGTPGTSDDFTIVKDVDTAPFTDWEEVSINLDNYSGQSVRVGIHNVGTDHYMFMVDDFAIQTTGTAGVKDVFANKFSVYPNPANNIVTISNTENIALNAVEVTDMNGRTVVINKFDGLSTAKINVSGLAAGVYMMNITSDKGVATKKIIKN